MNRELCKFLSGTFAALGYAHAAYAVATTRGIISEPVFRGRRWGVEYMWTEAAIYSAAGLVFGYLGWKTRSPVPPVGSSAAGDLRVVEAAGAGQTASGKHDPADLGSPTP